MKISKELRTEFNKRFANGEQYIEYREADWSPEDEGKFEEEHNAVIVSCDRDKRYYWEQKAVYNRILPIIDHFNSKYKNVPNYEELIYGQNGLVERLIPLQREYNNIKNRKNEFVDRLSLGIVFVEDGSVDVDELGEEGLEPGRIVIYRQGNVAPSVVQPDVTPYSVYSAELKRIEEEITDVTIEFQNNVLEAIKI